ncbi:ion channel protein [Leifsonia sp. Leaf264]|uniref:ion channel protein n=1 Tax=Leifsonia sp. Leaf264 TaxID=1736314 RepID=UPI0006FA61CD|nr:ion channel protein [Leifsonia sp. Leaf264]KQO95839.1 ion channel protein [Leifsonia sp. Leaf264]
MTDPSTPPAGAPPLRTTLILSLPAIAIGVLTAVILFAVSRVADALEDVVWTTLPTGLGVDDTTGWWTFGVLTLTGLVVGLIVWLMPGHAGPDPATTELVSTPLGLRTLPGLLLVTIIGLAGGVSLGPENPIIAINTALVVALMARLFPKVPTMLAVMLAASGTMGALFGTPVGAALILTGMVGMAKGGGALWDRLFLPLVAAGTGSITMLLLGEPQFAIALPPLGAPEAGDILSGVVVTVVAVLLGLGAVHVYPLLHRVFHLLRNPVIPLTVAGAILGILGVIGGEVTLFKGLTQMGELAQDADSMTVWQLTLVALVKIAALLIAASAGFRGGRIFPSAFIGVAIGLVAHAIVPAVPTSLAVACGVLGFVLVIARDGWLALFLAAIIVGDPTVLPILCIVILPAWLMVTRQPPFLIRAPQPGPEEAAANPEKAAP